MSFLTENIYFSIKASVSRSSKYHTSLTLFPVKEEDTNNSYSASSVNQIGHFSSKGVISNFGDICRFHSPTMITMIS